MTVERRRAIVEKIFGAAADRGVTIDADPLFRSWVEEWIDHEIDMDELRRRYDDLRRLRFQERRQVKNGAVVASVVPEVAAFALEEEKPEAPSLDQGSLEAVLISLQNRKPSTL